MMRLLTAGKTRLRPIFMTTSAMVMGMVPLALGLGEGGEQSAPMAHAVIGGVDYLYPANAGGGSGDLHLFR